jgi:hypothetical protein
MSLALQAAPQPRHIASVAGGLVQGNFLQHSWRKLSSYSIAVRFTTSATPDSLRGKHSGACGRQASSTMGVSQQRHKARDKTCKRGSCPLESRASTCCRVGTIPGCRCPQCGLPSAAALLPTSSCQPTAAEFYPMLPHTPNTDFKAGLQQHYKTPPAQQTKRTSINEQKIYRCT